MAGLKCIDVTTKSGAAGESTRAFFKTADTGDTRGVCSLHQMAGRARLLTLSLPNGMAKIRAARMPGFPKGAQVVQAVLKATAQTDGFTGNPAIQNRNCT